MVESKQVLVGNVEGDVFVSQMMELSVKSKNAHLRKHAIIMLERHGEIENIDLSDSEYIRRCK